MRAYERLLKYAQFNTASNENNPECPSSEGQWTLARALVAELNELGVSDVRVDEHCYVYGRIPANASGQPAIGFIAHMDTVDVVPCEPMNARVVSNYDGGDIVLSGDDKLTPTNCPSLKQRVGKDLIVTDGKTLLGADDKAGVAIIMTLCEELLSHPEVKHGDVCVAFTPDEEIGRGADLFDVPGFGAEFAYTIDGGALGELEYENFNAASAVVKVNGVSIHPGSAKNAMRNASLVAMEFDRMLPPFETPEHTEGREGFYHLCAMSGDIEHAELKYIIRDHDADKFEARKQTMTRIADFLNARYAPGTVELTLIDSYRNMIEQLLPHPEILDRARNAYKSQGVETISVPIRGGTDGARLSFMGLPCPNLATGGGNAHGRHEYACVQEMDAMVNVLRAIIEC